MLLLRCDECHQALNVSFSMAGFWIPRQWDFIPKAVNKSAKFMGLHCPQCAKKASRLVETVKRAEEVFYNET
jgi:hypothetical protein